MFDLTYRISLEDYLEFIRHQRSRVRRPWQRLAFLWLLVIINVILALTNTVPALGGDGNWTSAIHNILIIAVLLIVIYVFVPWMLKRIYNRTKLEQSDVHLLMEDTIVVMQHIDLKTDAKWSAFIDISRTSKSIFLWLNKSHAFIIPLHAFTSPNEAEKLYQYAKDKIDEASNDDGT